jgi:hypothetical protein
MSRPPDQLRGACAALAAAFICYSCGGGPGQQPPIAEAFAGPMSLNLRRELAQRAEVTATVQHGDRLDILQYHRRFVKVRTAKGAEGWTDTSLLLKPAQMSRLRNSAQQASKRSSLGAATPFDLLNVHIDPHRQSPSFYLLQESEMADVIDSRLVPRMEYTPGKTPAEEDAPPGTPIDSWTLVRLNDGRPGWVLSRLIMMAIPDEVAQYAEGHHITSYFSLGTVKDRGQPKHHWLWTTTPNRLQPADFDSFRVFVWNARRHRYETTHIERGLAGYFPVNVSTVEGAVRFALSFRGRDKQLLRRTYEFRDLKVRLVAKSPWHPPEPEPDSSSEEPKETAPKPEPSRNLLASLRERLMGLLGR